MKYLPSDWHAGLSILQSTMNIVLNGVLQPIGIKCLGWRRIQKDARNCYFQDSRLVMYIYQQLSAVLMQLFATQKLEELRILFQTDETDLTNANLCAILLPSLKSGLNAFMNI